MRHPATQQARRPRRLGTTPQPPRSQTEKGKRGPDRHGYAAAEPARNWGAATQTLGAPGPLRLAWGGHPVRPSLKIVEPMKKIPCPNCSGEPRRRGTPWRLRLGASMKFGVCRLKFRPSPSPLDLGPWSLFGPWSLVIGHSGRSAIRPPILPRAQRLDTPSRLTARKCHQMSPNVTFPDPMVTFEKSPQPIEYEPLPFQTTLQMSPKTHFMVTFGDI